MPVGAPGGRPSSAVVKAPAIADVAEHRTAVYPVVTGPILTTSKFAPSDPLQRVQVRVVPPRVGRAGHEPVAAVVGDDHPVALHRGQDHPRLRRERRDVERGLEPHAHAHRRAVGARVAARVVRSPARRTPGASARREPQRVADLARVRRPRRSARGRGRSAARRRRPGPARRARGRRPEVEVARRCPPSSRPPPGQVCPGLVERAVVAVDHEDVTVARRVRRRPRSGRRPGSGTGPGRSRRRSRRRSGRFGCVPGTTT